MEKQRHLYEVLLRYGPKGFIGGHAVDADHFIDDAGVVHASTALQPRPIREDEVGEIIGAESAKLIEHIAALKDQVQSETARADAGIGALEALQEQMDRFSTSADSMAKRLKRPAVAEAVEETSKEETMTEEEKELGVERTKPEHPAHPAKPGGPVPFDSPPPLPPPDPPQDPGPIGP